MASLHLRPTRLAALIAVTIATSFTLVGVGVVPAAHASPACPTGMTPYVQIGCTQTLSFTGGLQTRTVHAGFSDVMAAVTGAQGGGFCDGGTDPTGGGNGVENDGIFPVSTGELLTVLVGGLGHGSTLAPCNATTNDGLGGYGGGGDGNAANIPGGGGGSFLWAGSTLEMVSGGGGGVSGGGLGGESDSQGAPQTDPLSGLGGMPGTTTGPGAGGAAGDVVEGQPTPPAGNPGTGPTTSPTSLAKGGASVFGRFIPDSGPEQDQYSGAGGGGLYGGGSGGCSDEFDGCGGGGGGASFSASNVKPGTPQSAGGLGNGAVVLTYLFGCPTPSFTLIRGGRVSGTGLATLDVEANVGDPAQCGTPELQLTGDGVGRAHFQGNVQLQMISQGVAQAKREFPAADSCWITGSLKLSQTESGHAARVATDNVATVPKPEFKVAKAKRTASGVHAEVEAISLPPVSHCGKAKLLLNGSDIARLKSKTDSQTGDELVVRGLRVPASDECLKRLHFKAVPNDSAGSDAKRAVRVTGDGKNVLTVCRRGP